MTEHNDKDAKQSVETGLIEKAFLMGLGATVFAREKAEELADELIKRGQITRSDSEGFVGRLSEKADETTSSLGKAIAKETTKVIEAMGLASKKDVERLQVELTEIKALLASRRSDSDGPIEP